MKKLFTKYVFLIVAIMFGVAMAGSVVLDRSSVSADEQTITSYSSSFVN